MRWIACCTAPKPLPKRAIIISVQALPLVTEIQSGNQEDKQVRLLFSGPRRKLLQITLRNHAVLAAHKAAEPITIHCIAGSATLESPVPGEQLVLAPGVLITIEPNVYHEIRATPAVSILLSKFGTD